jgi:redox-sensitive bicupin YhaK (pirin superfamily)
VFREDVPAGHTAFAYVDRGRVEFGEADALQSVDGPALVVFGDGDFIRARGNSKDGRFLLAAARPLGEPIARYGPFVMNTREEIEKTLDELRSGRFIREEAVDA